MFTILGLSALLIGSITGSSSSVKSISSSAGSTTLCVDNSSGDSFMVSIVWTEDTSVSSSSTMAVDPSVATSSATKYVSAGCTTGASVSTAGNSVSTTGASVSTASSSVTKYVS